MMDNIVLTVSDSLVRSYLEAVVAFLRPVPDGFKYAGYEDLILREGKRFTEARQEISGPIKQCYANSYTLAESTGYDYYEGYAFGIALPVMHAWCVDEDGVVVETTWPEVGTDYFGVKLPLPYVRRTILTTEVWGVLDAGWMVNHQLLREGLRVTMVESGE